jgi:hypothetical protein
VRASRSRVRPRAPRRSECCGAQLSGSKYKVCFKPQSEPNEVGGNLSDARLLSSRGTAHVHRTRYDEHTHRDSSDRRTLVLQSRVSSPVRTADRELAHRDCSAPTGHSPSGHTEVQIDMASVWRAGRHALAPSRSRSGDYEFGSTSANLCVAANICGQGTANGSVVLPRSVCNREAQSLDADGLIVAIDLHTASAPEKRLR